MADADLDRVVAKYIALRAEKKTIEERHKSELATYVAALDKLEAFLGGKLNDANVESMRTSSGTFFKAKKTSVTVASRETYLKWVRENDQWDLVDVRAAKSNIIEHMDSIDETTGAKKGLPPGLNYHAEIEIQIRKAA